MIKMFIFYKYFLCDIGQQLTLESILFICKKGNNYIPAYRAVCVGLTGALFGKVLSKLQQSL